MDYSDIGFYTVTYEDTLKRHVPQGNILKQVLCKTKNRK